MRKKIVAGNWKMNKTFAEGITLTNEIIDGLKNSQHQCNQVILCTPFLHLQKVSELCNEEYVLQTAAQNCHTENSGAYTGEISASMIQSVGATHVLVGHSERRMYNAENNSMLAKKVDIALANELTVVFCCGESLEIRNAGNHIAFVNEQIESSLFHLSKEAFKNIVIAYEPIWAIGTGLTASKEQAQEMHFQIRAKLNSGYGEEIANETSILYGGSCNAQNAKELFSQPDVDGGLIGGASLKAADFLTIIQSF